MLRQTALLSALAAFGLVGSAHAEEHYVLLLGNGYFPETVYPVPGDTIRFLNMNESPMAATATDGSWSTGLLFENADYILPVTEGMTTSYDNSVPDLGGLLDVTDTTALLVDTIVANGYIDYENPAPVVLNDAGEPIILQDEEYDTRDGEPANG